MAALFGEGGTSEEAQELIRWLDLVKSSSCREATAKGERWMEQSCSAFLAAFPARESVFRNIQTFEQRKTYRLNLISQSYAARKWDYRDQGEEEANAYALEYQRRITPTINAAFDNLESYADTRGIGVFTKEDLIEYLKSTGWSEADIKVVLDAPTP